MNFVLLSGYLGDHPEITTGQTGTKIAKFSLATSDGKKDESGQRVSNWHRCVAFNHTAELVGQFCQKGSYLEVQGRIEYETWQDKTTGEKKYATKILVSNIGLGPKTQERSSPPPAANFVPPPKSAVRPPVPPRTQPQAAPAPMGVGEAWDPNSDLANIPF